MMLSLTERARIAEELLTSLDDQVDEDVEKAWQAEIGRRIDEAESGLVEFIPWEEMFATLRANARTNS
ncbi:MAG: addiction module protein [Ignavibacteriae bacterium]|nr:addiction module protein [Ignavibacteriota bacterium]